MEKKSSKQLYNKLLFIYTAVIFCIVLALTIYFWNSMQNRYLESNLEYVERMHEEAVGYVEDCAEIADYLHGELYKSDMELNDLVHYLADDMETYHEYRLDVYSQYYLLAYNGFEDFFITGLEAYPSLLRVAVASYGKGDLTSINRTKSVYHTSDGGAVLDRIKNGDLAGEGEFSFMKEIRDPVTMQSMGAMIMTFDAKNLQTIHNYYEGPHLVVYNESERIVYDSCNHCMIQNLEKERQEGTLEESLRAYVQAGTVDGYCVVSYLKRAEASGLPVPTMLMITGVAVFVFLMGEFLVRYDLQRLSLRLNGILDGMTQVMGGDLTVRLAVEKNRDELDVIARHFNEMCEKLDMYIQKSYLAEMEQKNAEMAALQSQINPHFLYNTLEAIRMKAICNGDQEVGKMLYSMAVTFRSQLKEADVITLAQELHYCKKYLELFEYRYPSQFQSDVECPLEYMNVPVIKFVLQPVLENYFIHGIRLRDKDNYIRIMVEKRDGDFEIIVEDNGRGMTIEEIEARNCQLRENKIDKNKSIGTANVNRRIKAVYGNAYGLHMEQAASGGVRVVLRFRPEEGEQDEKSNDC